MSKKLVIFDCDGVLVDSEIVASRVFAEAMTAFGYPLSTEESICRFTGISEQAARQMIMHESNIDIPVDYWTLQQPHLFMAYERELKALMLPILEMLKIQDVTCCVASNSAKNHVVRCLELTDQLSYFNDPSIFTAQQVAKGKPAPDLFLLAAKEMGFEPKDCIVIEDSLAGIEAAIAANMQVLAFLGGSHAGFDSYQTKISAYGVPVMQNCEELTQAIISSKIGRLGLSHHKTT